MSTYTDAQQQALRLAGQALHAEQARKWQDAARCVEAIDALAEPGVMALVMQAWIDTYIAHALGGPHKVPDEGLGHNGALDFFDVTTGQSTSDTTPPDVRWAGRLIQSRVQRNWEAWSACIDELDDMSPEDVGSHVLSVLHVVAETTRALPAGFALMGRDT